MSYPLIQTRNSLEYNVSELARELNQLPYIVRVNVVEKNNKWFDFQIITNLEFLDNDQLDHIFELVIDSNLETRFRTGRKIYFKHSFIGVEKYYVEDEEFDTWSEAYSTASQLVDGDWLTEEGLEPYQLIEVREI